MELILLCQTFLLFKWQVRSVLHWSDHSA